MKKIVEPVQQMNELPGAEFVSCDWSPDGERFCVSDRDGCVMAFQPSRDDKEPIWQSSRTAGTVVVVVRWSPDAAQFAALTESGSLNLYDGANRSAQFEVALPELRGSRTLDWNRRGQTLLACGSAGGVGALVDLRSRRTWPIESAKCVAWCGDILLATGGARVLTMWPDGVRTPVWRIDPGLDVTSISYDETNGVLAIAGGTTIQLRSVDTGRLLLQWEAHREAIQSLRWSRTGLLASASGSGMVCLWRNGTLVGAVEQEAPVFDAAFSPDDGRLLTASADGILRIWDVADLIDERPSPIVIDDSGGYVARQAITVGRRVSSSRLQDEQLPSRVLEGDAPGFARAAFLPDGDLLSVHPDGIARRWEPRSGAIRWKRQLASLRRGTVHALIVSPLSSDAVAYVGSLEVVFGMDGSDLMTTRAFTGAVDAAWSPAGSFYAVASPGSAMVFRQTGTGQSVCAHSSRVRSVTWSPDGLAMATGADDGIHIWEPLDGTLVRSFGVQDERIWAIRWSGDGSRIATACGGYFARIFDVIAPDREPLELKHGGMVAGLAWSPGGQFLATTSFDGTLRVWEPWSGAELLRFTTPRGWHRSPAWSPDGEVIATCSNDDRIHLWRTAAEVRASAPFVRPGAEPPIRAILPNALAQLHRLQIHPPLSLLLDALQLTGGDEGHPSLAGVASSRGMRELVALGWPIAARVGLAALLLQNVQSGDWEPPDDLPPNVLRDVLARALLVGERVEPEPPPRPLEALIDAANRIDDRIISLLEIIGPKAVTRDPGLPIRALPRLGQLRPLHRAQRQRLGLRTPLGTSGRASGTGSGGERGGFDLRGDLRALLPTQLALPDDVLRFRHLRGELLYRAKLGQEPPQLRPAVIVLDVSPAGLGPIERVTRIAAHILGSTLLEARMPSVLVLTGGSELVRVLERTDDLIELWTHRSHKPADCARTLRIARGMREQIAGDGVDPIILVLTHAWFGAEDDVPATPGLRGLFVQYPNQHVRPALASRCDRWESLGIEDLDRLPSTLGALIR